MCVILKSASCDVQFQADQFSRWHIHRAILDAFWFLEGFAEVMDIPYNPLRNGLNDPFEARKIMHYSFQLCLPLAMDYGLK
jgi:hypothetical protein